jgi:hypothetical protein
VPVPVTACISNSTVSLLAAALIHSLQVMQASAVCKLGVCSMMSSRLGFSYELFTVFLAQSISSGPNHKPKSALMFQSMPCSLPNRVGRQPPASITN